MSTFHDQPRPPWGAYWNRPNPQWGAVRVSHAERAEVSDALLRHFTDGRLDEDEYGERLAKANAAKTRADLAPLLADLPPLDRPEGHPPPPRWRQGRGGPGWVVLAVLAFLAFSWVATGLFGAALHLHFPVLLFAILLFVLIRRRRWHHHHEMP